MSGNVLPPRLQPGRLAPTVAIQYGRESEPWFELGWPGIDPLVPCLDMISLDHSGSVVAPGGTDPIGRRFDEAKRAIRTVQAWTATRRPKVAVLHFDQPSIGNSGVIALTERHALRRLSESLAIPSDAFGGSDLLPSLDVAERLARKHPDHEARFTILSDFAITDADPAAVFKRLAAFPGQVHAVVLNAAPPPDLTGENIAITEVGYDDPPGAVAAAIHRSLTATRRGRRLSVLHADRTKPSVPPLSPGKSTTAVA